MQRIFASDAAGSRRGSRGLFRDESGTAAIEMAFVAMPLFLFIFAIINTGHVLWLQNALETSVMQAARCATVNSEPVRHGEPDHGLRRRAVGSRLQQRDLLVRAGRVAATRSRRAIR